MVRSVLRPARPCSGGRLGGGGDPAELAPERLRRPAVLAREQQARGGLSEPRDRVAQQARGPLGLGLRALAVSVRLEPALRQPAQELDLLLATALDSIDDGGVATTLPEDDPPVA